MGLTPDGTFPQIGGWSPATLSSARTLRVYTWSMTLSQQSGPNPEAVTEKILKDSPAEKNPTLPPLS